MFPAGGRRSVTARDRHSPYPVSIPCRAAPQGDPEHGCRTPGLPSVPAGARIARGLAMEPDNARELKARLLALLPAHPWSVPRPDAGSTRLPWVAVGLAPAGGGRARVA